jgi:cell division protein FtsQ
VTAAKGVAMASVSRSGRARVAALPLRSGTPLPRLAFAKALPSGRALLLGFALLAAGALAYIGARETSVFALRTVVVTGASPQVAAHVRTALRSLEGRSLLALGQGDVERRLANLSDVAAVSVNRDFPHTLRLTVTPAHSIAVLRRGPSAWIVSSDGRVIREAPPTAAPKLPRIWVPRAASVDVGAPIADTDAARALHAVAVARGARFGVRIAAVRSTDAELTFVLPGGPELRLGDMTELPVKLAVARRLLPLVAGTSAYIDLSVPARPISGGNTQVSG